MPNLDNVKSLYRKAFAVLVDTSDVMYTTPRAPPVVSACAYKPNVIFDGRIVSREMSTLIYTLARDVGSICSVMSCSCPEQRLFYIEMDCRSVLSTKPAAAILLKSGKG